MKYDLEFNNHSHNTQSINQTIHEHRAVTDDSIRMLNEFQTKSQENIIKQVRIQDSVVDAIGIVYYKAFNLNCRPTFHYQIRFKVNGKEFLIKDDIQESDLDHFELKDKMVIQIAKTISDVITREVLQELIKAQIYV